ncbi:UPF0262 family protein [Oceaniglobus indicus]|uniref:UPF0262 family protein n=1 Tax=Oceaniglobus indicus TaxID=2047749 RepID=UPI000C19E2C2|nr:UPF0262 family protein [Oceaniglobus indicus]
MSRIVHIDIDDSDLPPPSADVEQERRIAIFDLLEDNSFVLADKGAEGALHLSLAVRQGRFVFAITSPDDTPVAEFRISPGPLRQVIKDYATVCESYSDAVRRLPPARIEAIDLARRGIHAEGARILSEQIDPHARVDPATARRLFTLLCVLIPDG